MSLSERNYFPLFNNATRSGNFVGGATVTQQTNRTTGVTINAISGQITTNTTSLAGAAAATFTVTNSEVFADDVVVCSIAGGSVSGNTDVYVASSTAGSFTITVANQTAATAETGAIAINFLVMKASQTS